MKPRPDPEPETFDREVTWPVPRRQPDREHTHPDNMPLDDERDRRWL